MYILVDSTDEGEFLNAQYVCCMPFPYWLICRDMSIKNNYKLHNFHCFKTYDKAKLCLGVGKEVDFAKGWRCHGRVCFCYQWGSHFFFLKKKKLKYWHYNKKACWTLSVHYAVIFLLILVGTYKIYMIIQHVNQYWAKPTK